MRRSISSLEIWPAHLEDRAWKLSFFGEELESITEFDPLTGQKTDTFDRVRVYANSHYVTPRPTLNQAIEQIKTELKQTLAHFQKEGKLLEAQRIEQRVQYDLEMLAARLGLHWRGTGDPLDEADMVDRPTDGESIRFGTWRLLQTDYIVIGWINDAPGGTGYDIVYQLFDVHKQEQLLSRITTVGPGDLRFGAHRVADAIYETLTGEPGAFDTRIAYITDERGADGTKRLALKVADADVILDLPLAPWEASLGTTLRVPTLVIHGAADEIVPVDASEVFEGVASAERRTYPDLRHELHNEPEGRQIYDEVIDWIEGRLSSD